MVRHPTWEYDINCNVLQQKGDAANDGSAIWACIYCDTPSQALMIEPKAV